MGWLNDLMQSPTWFMPLGSLFSLTKPAPVSGHCEQPSPGLVYPMRQDSDSFKIIVMATDKQEIISSVEEMFFSGFNSKSFCQVQLSF